MQTALAQRAGAVCIRKSLGGIRTEGGPAFSRRVAPYLSMGSAAKEYFTFAACRASVPYSPGANPTYFASKNALLSAIGKGAFFIDSGNRAWYNRRSKSVFAARERVFLNHVTARKCEPDEIPQVKALFETAFVNTFFDHAPVFEEVTDGEKIYAALLNDSIVGFASIWEPDYFVHFLFVSPSFRRKKVGSALADRLAEIYDGPLTVKCLIKNETGMAFYRSTGWKQTGDGISEDGAYALLRYSVRKE